MLELGHGWGLSLADGTLVASTVVLLYGSGFAWVSMVLVLPEHRRKGHASRLLRVAIADLKARGLTPILDATPDGREVYRQEGFHDTWGFKRYSLRKPAPVIATPSVRPMRAEDWEAVRSMDRAAFGADRGKLLRNLAQRQPGAALVHEAGGRVDGFVLGREGRESMQLGPLICSSAEGARALLDAGLARVQPPLYVDLADHAPTLLDGKGFEFQRPFTRMVYGAGLAPGRAAAVYLVAGPELG
jgi:predicted N-acetyltransferase YhbS